ncbi:MAG: YHS domain-containing protein [Chloroflexi bacterium]|nr:YHS domain-containing protein [Chloroflexota bacterium]
MPTFAPLLRRWLSGARGPSQRALPSAVGAPAAVSEAESARDPVCGMVITRDSAAGTSQHAGRTVYFCSLGCKRRFDEAPDQFPLD